MRFRHCIIKQPAHRMDHQPHDAASFFNAFMNMDQALKTRFLRVINKKNKISIFVVYFYSKLSFFKLT